MFQNQVKEAGPLHAYLTYYQEEAQRLKGYCEALFVQYKKLDGLEQGLFELHNRMAKERLEVEKRKYRLKLGQLIRESENPAEEIEKLLVTSGEVPREIRGELNSMRTKLAETYQDFKSQSTTANLAKIIDFKLLLKEAVKRDEINDVSKELVNLRQGYLAIGPEMEGENEELAYLRGQEGGLEEVAMAKALPSTRILLKTQYIPLMEREIAMLNRADQFLSEIINTGKELKENFVNCFFRKRHAFPQFMRGRYCLDTQRGMRSNTVRNINSAFTLWSDKYRVALAPAYQYDNKADLKKMEILGPGAVDKHIREIWMGGTEDQFILLPGSYTLREALAICESKDKLAEEIPQTGQSKHSITVIYVGEIPWAEITGKKDLLDRYHRAIMSNIFIDIDGVNVYNNRQSIYEALVIGTFGMSNDPVSQEVAHLFLNEA